MVAWSVRKERRLLSRIVISRDRPKRGALEAFATDFQIWRHKRPALKIMALKTDGPFKVGREWYSQFYRPRLEAGDEGASLDGVYHVPGVDTPADRDHAIDDGLPI